jgi:predicted SAM-dependent methyltransferase
MSLRSLIAETIRPIRRELQARRRVARKFPAGQKLNLGCGAHLREGWVNVDLGGAGGSVDWDLTKPIPLPDHSIRFIYSEHFIEHITRDEALRHFSDCRRLLSAEGVLRLSTPN